MHSSSVRAPLRHPLTALAVLVIALVAVPAAARTSAMPVDPVCVEADCPDAVDANGIESQKAAGSEKRSAPAATRSNKPGNTRASAGRKPRWHRFLPGMYR